MTRTAVIAAGLALAAILLRSVGPAFLPGASLLALIGGAALGAVPPLATFARRERAGDLVKLGLPFAIVLLGAGLDLRVLADPRVGFGGLAVLVVAVTAGFLGAAIGARIAGVSRGTMWLLGAGTAICGNSAIVAAAPAVGADDDEIALSLATINLLGVVAMLVVPPLALAVGLGGVAGGALAGATVHAVPQAVAAGESLGPAAASFASLFKMVRVSLLGPVILLLARFARRPDDGPTAEGDARAKRPGVPPFLYGFLALAAARTAGLLSFDVGGFAGAQDLAALLGGAARGALTFVMAAVGLQLDFGKLRAAGPRALAAGTIASVLMVGATLAAVVAWGAAAG